MPKTLIADIYSGYEEQQDEITEPTMPDPDTLDTAPPEPEAAEEDADLGLEAGGDDEGGGIL
jgi:hypothetical protein